MVLAMMTVMLVFAASARVRITFCGFFSTLSTVRSFDRGFRQRSSLGSKGPEIAQQVHLKVGIESSLLEINCGKVPDEDAYSE